MVHNDHYGHGGPYTFLLNTERLMLDGWMDGWMDEWMDWRKREENYQRNLFFKRCLFGCVGLSCSTWDLHCIIWILWCMNFLVVVCGHTCPEACGI